MPVLLQLLSLTTAMGVNFFAALLAMGYMHHTGQAFVPDPMVGFVSFPVLIFAAIGLFADEIASFIKELPAIGAFLDVLWAPTKVIITTLGMLYLAWQLLFIYDNPFTTIFLIVALTYVTCITLLLITGFNFIVNFLPPGAAVVSKNVQVAIAGGLSAIGLNAQEVSVILSVIVLVVAMVYAPRMLRFLIFYYRTIRSRFRSQQADFDPAPDGFEPKQGEIVIGALSAIPRNLPNFNGRAGTLVLTSERLVFGYKKLMGLKTWETPLITLDAYKRYTGVLASALTVGVNDSQRSPQFIVLKERADLLSRITKELDRLTKAEVISTDEDIIDKAKAFSDKSVALSGDLMRKAQETTANMTAEDSQVRKGFNSFMQNAKETASNVTQKSQDALSNATAEDSQARKRFDSFMQNAKESASSLTDSDSDTRKRVGGMFKDLAQKSQDAVSSMQDTASTGESTSRSQEQRFVEISFDDEVDEKSQSSLPQERFEDFSFDGNTDDEPSSPPEEPFEDFTFDDDTDKST